jgi:molecular chaperone GrpE (heat shock protein)
MSDALKWKVPKIPFIIVGLLLVGFGFYFVQRAPLSLGHWAFAAVCIASVSLGAIIAILPFYYDYKAMGRALEVNALGTVADKIENLDQLTAKICAASDQWTVVQESVGANAEKTAVSAKQIAEKMGHEVREFSEFMKKINDSEKSALRLEVDKFRRGEVEWVQTLVRLLDHIFALHMAAVRSSQPGIADQITQFQNACRGTVRRIGLASFVGEPNEAFSAERHQVADPKQKPFDGAVVAETVASGYTYQGKLLRPALVRLREPNAPVTQPTSNIPPMKAGLVEPLQDDFALEPEPITSAPAEPFSAPPENEASNS